MTTVHLSNGTIHIHITGAGAGEITETGGVGDRWTIKTEHRLPEVAAPWRPDHEYESFVNDYE
ncbi:MAG: hypothetical protein JWR01_152 [Subtercola sp.]|nr:hypothetical protein [Subtercola sp.]